MEVVTTIAQPKLEDALHVLDVLREQFVNGDATHMVATVILRNGRCAMVTAMVRPINRLMIEGALSYTALEWHKANCD